eukprot:418404-Prorocentrum_minimum.AAC.2
MSGGGTPSPPRTPFCSASWPHAPLISCPIVIRTVDCEAQTPQSVRHAPNRPVRFEQNGYIYGTRGPPAG